MAIADQPPGMIELVSSPDLAGSSGSVGPGGAVLLVVEDAGAGLPVLPPPELPEQLAATTATHASIKAGAPLTVLVFVVIGNP